VRRFEFRDFKQAFLFMTMVAHKAEEMDHHPGLTPSPCGAHLCGTFLLGCLAQRYSKRIPHRRLNHEQRATLGSYLYTRFLVQVSAGAPNSPVAQLESRVKGV
jgi:hypothetical protein